MGSNVKTRRYVAILLAALFVLGYAAVLFLPYPKAVGLQEEKYSVAWSDGSVTEDSFSDAYACLSGITDTGDILLEKEEKFGTYVSKNGMKAAVATLKNAELAPMLAMEVSVDRLERAALFRAFGDTLWFDAGDWFCFDGERVALTSPTAQTTASTVVYTGGTLLGSLLAATQAEKLIVGDLADFSYRTLLGTAVHVEGKTRYIVENGVILDTALSRTLVACEPLSTEVFVPDVVAAARGALLPAKELTFVDLPFVGSGPVAAGEKFNGQFAYLFTEGEAYHVPSSLKKVRVRGGELISFAFYGCPDVEEIDACGVDPYDIERQAFSGLTSLKYLHTPRADVDLSELGKFVSHVADCGCTVYEKINYGPEMI